MIPRRVVPTLSAAKLAQYISASAAGRQKIIVDAVSPSIYMIDRYRLPQHAIAQSIYSGNTEDCNSMMSALARKPARSEQHAQRLRDGIDCIKAFLGATWSYAPDATHLIKIHSPINYVEIEGVRVIVAPHLGSLYDNGRDRKSLGCFRLYSSKSQPLNPDMAADICVIMHWFGEQALRSLGLTDATMCAVGDVFKDRLYYGPKNYKKRRANLSAGCREIADRWSSFYARASEPTKRAA